MYLDQFEDEHSEHSLLEMIRPQVANHLKCNQNSLVEATTWTSLNTKPPMLFILYEYLEKGSFKFCCNNEPGQQCTARNISFG